MFVTILPTINGSIGILEGFSPSLLAGNFKPGRGIPTIFPAGVRTLTFVWVASVHQGYPGTNSFFLSRPDTYLGKSLSTYEA